MTRIINFSSPEEMQKYLHTQAKTAHAGLHQQQEALTFGDCWIQFHDIANRHVIFGRIHTLEEVGGAEIECGATGAEAREVVAETRASLRGGYMYGRAHDKFNPDGELGTTHKAHVWPIDESVHLMADEVGYDMDRLPLSAKVNIQVAYTAMRGHVRGE